MWNEIGLVGLCVPVLKKDAMNHQHRHRHVELSNTQHHESCRSSLFFLPPMNLSVSKAFTEACVMLRVQPVGNQQDCETIDIYRL